MIKSKPCKAQDKARDYENACGKETNVQYRKFGLCSSCLYDWMTTTENGKIYYQKQFLPKVIKVTRANKTKAKRKQKIELMSADKYRAKYLQPNINKIARLIDYGHPCTARNTFEGKMSGGHFTSVGSNRTIAINLHNIFIQSFQSNVWNGGDDTKYREGLEMQFGKEYLEFVEGLKKHRPIKLSKEQFMALNNEAKEIIKELESNLIVRTFNERIEARNIVNERLNVYDNEFSQFELTKAKVNS